MEREFVSYEIALALKELGFDVLCCTIIIGFYFGIDTPNNFDFIDFYSKNYKTYEEAELECLKKLIEIVKNK